MGGDCVKVVVGELESKCGTLLNGVGQGGGVWQTWSVKFN